MTKTMIIVVMEELSTIILVTVIMMTYRRDSMERKKINKKLDLIRKLVW